MRMMNSFPKSVLKKYSNKFYRMYITMTDNKFAVILSSVVDNATVRIQLVVNTPMNAEQLATYYKCKSLTISDVEVLPA